MYTFLDAQHMRLENTYLHENYTTDPSNLNNSMEIDITNKMRFYDSTNDRTLVDASPEDIEAAKLLLDAMAANEVPYHYHRPPPPPPPPAIVADTIMPDFQNNTSLDTIDEGELSDASTILLDQDELREAYRRRSFDDNPMEDDDPVINRVAGEFRSDLEKEISVIHDQSTAATAAVPTLDLNNVDSFPNVPNAASTIDRMNVPDTSITIENVSPKDADTSSGMPSPCVSPTSTSTSVPSKTVPPISVPLASTPPLTNSSPITEPRKSISPLNNSLTSTLPLNVSPPIEDAKPNTMNTLSTTNIVHAPTTNGPTATTKAPLNNTLSTLSNLTGPVIEKKPIRKISLQEYLFNQQQKKMH